MAEISAAMVMKLRKMSGQGMMDCKRALQDTDGDVEKALDLLRKKASQPWPSVPVEILPKG